MTRAALLGVALVAAAALGAPPARFEKALARFPALALPVTLTEAGKLEVKLTAADFDALGLRRDTSPALAPLRRFTLKPDEGERRTLWAVGALRREGHAVALLRLDEELPLTHSARTFLVVFAGDGSLNGALLFHDATSSEALEASGQSTLDTTGTIFRKVKTLIPQHEEGLPEALVVLSELRWRLTSKGLLESAPVVFTHRNGRFVDAKSKEELRFVDGKVFYRGSEAKPFQQLEGELPALRFKGSTKQYLLTFDEARKAVRCQNPDGAVQTFTREW